MGSPPELGERLRQLHPHIHLYKENIVEEAFNLYPVSIVLCERRVPVCGSPMWLNAHVSYVLNIGDGNNSTKDPPGWWASSTTVRHTDFGGATCASCVVSIFGKMGYPHPHLLTGFSPRGALSALLDHGERGRYATKPTAGQPCPIERESKEQPWDDLIRGRGDLSKTFIVPCFRLPSGWCSRKLTIKEQHKVLDCSSDMFAAMGQPEDWQNLLYRVPIKIRKGVLRVTRLTFTHKVNPTTLDTSQNKEIDMTDNTTKMDLISRKEKGLGKSQTASTTPHDNVKKATPHDHNLKAARADDAEVPYWIWNERIQPLLKDRGINERDWEIALETIRQKFALKIWVKNVLRSYLGWRKTVTQKDLLRRCDEAARDALTRATLASWWEWDCGSRFFFWRWPKAYVAQARDGVKPWFTSTPEPWRKRQQVPSDPVKRDLMRKKVQKVRARGYVAPGTVTSLMNVFDVPKGDDDIRLVYDGTKSGLNDRLWAPWFILPTVESSLRGIGNCTWMGDNDIAEQFHNFVLHEDLQPLCGIDLTELFKTEGEGKPSLHWERWTRAPMGIKLSPYQAAQGMIWWEEVVRGDRFRFDNVFRWDRVKMNLPGKVDYEPNEAWVSKRRSDETIASDFKSYVDDIRTTGGSREDGWQATRRVGSIAAYLGVQDASRKRREVSRRPGAWAGSITRTTGNEVVVTVSQDRWEKTQTQLQWLKHAIDEDENHIPFKKLESVRGFLVYVTRTYPASVPYLKGIHLTLDSWRSGRDNDGWANRQLALLHIDEAEPGQSEGSEKAPDFVKAVPRLKDDVEALLALFDGPDPVERTVRPSKTAVALYGFGDASGSGFGFTLLKQGHILFRHGQWSQSHAAESSNHRELLNLIVAIEEHSQRGDLNDSELFVFTDNTTAEAAFYKGTSKSKTLFQLILRLRVLQMKHSLNLYIIHVAGTRMISQGTDGLSRGELDRGVFETGDMLSFVPIHLSPLERSADLLSWITRWYPDLSLHVMSPEDWYDDAAKSQHTHFLWHPPPAAADAAVEQLCYERLKRPWATHLFICPRLFTSRWRKQLSKTADFILTLPWGEGYWNKSQHEPLLLAVCLPMLRSKPWIFRKTPTVERVVREVSTLSETDPGRLGPLLHEFFVSARAMDTVPSMLV